MKIKTTPLSEFGIDASIFAHSPSETLQEHSDLTLEYCEKILSSKKLETLIDSLIIKVDEAHHKLIKEMFFDAIYLHDLGKTNPNFQAKKMQNPKFKEFFNSTKSSDHSFLSSDMYIEYYQKKLQEFKRVERYKLFLYSIAFRMLSQSIMENSYSLKVIEMMKKM